MWFEIDIDIIINEFAASKRPQVGLAVKCRLVEINESKAIHLHFYAKIKNGFSLVKKALRRPQNAPFISNFSGGHAP